MPQHLRQLPLAIALAVFTGTTQAQVLEEVIVTAQKRAESLQDVPISVSAMQGDKLQSAGIPNLQALSDHVPNLYIAAASVNTNIYMRGVGSGNNQGFEQSVGMYVDGISRPATTPPCRMMTSNSRTRKSTPSRWAASTCCLAAG